MKIVVNDANILIDLADLDLLTDFSKLNFELHTNNVIVDYEIKKPEQKAKVYKLINVGKLKVEIVKTEDYTQINALKVNNLSFQDCSIWFYAKQINGVLLTGDGNLRKAAKAAGTEVRGILFIFDQLVALGVITKTTAVDKIKILVENNSRLPKAEIDKRIKLWSKL